MQLHLYQKSKKLLLHLHNRPNAAIKICAKIPKKYILFFVELQ